MTSSFKFGNATESATREIKTYDLGVVENYALTSDEPTVVVLKNTTTPIDAEEILSFRCRDMGKVNTNLNIQYPGVVQSGIQYQAQLEAVLSTQDAETNFRVDEPIVVSLSIRHPKSGNITEANVVTLVERLLSAMMKDDGSWRINDLMRSALRPTAN